MTKKHLFFPLMLNLLCSVFVSAQAIWTSSGCNASGLIIEKILIDACESEGINEFVILNTNNTSLSSVEISNMNIIGSSAIPGTISNNFAANPFTIAHLNSLVGNCTSPVFVNYTNTPYNGTIPPNSKVIIFPFIGSPTLISNLASLCGTGPYFVLNGNYNSNAGFFVNGLPGCFSNCTRTLSITIGGCTVTVTYDRNTFPVGNGSNIITGGTQVQGNGDCFPVVSCTTPTATASAISNNFCSGQTQNIQLNLTTNAPMGSTYSWSGPNSFTSNLQNPIISNANLPVGTHNYSVTVTVPGGCTATTTATITVNATPIFTPIPDVTVCGNVGLPLLVTPMPSANATYQWSGTGLSSTSSANPTATLPTQGLTPPFYTNYNYTVTITETNGCTWTDNFVIQTRVAPATINVQTPVSACLGQPFNLTVNSGTFSISGIPFTTTSFPDVVEFSWTGPNGYSNTTQTSTVPHAITVNQAQAPSSAGTYVYTLNTKAAVFSHSSCISQPQNVVVNIQVPTVVITTTKTLCQGQNVDLNTLISSPTPIPSITWSGTGVTTSPIFNSSALAAGNYTLTFTPVASACVNSGIATITVAPALSVMQNPISGKLCGSSAPYAGTVSLSVKASGSPTYQWSSGVIGGGNAVTVNSPGTYTVTVTDGSGCTDVKTFNVTASPNPVVGINAPPALCTGVATTLTLNNSFNTYLWSDGSTNESLNVSGPGVYGITVTNTNGCSATSSVNIVNSTVGQLLLNPSPTSCGANDGAIEVAVTQGTFTTYNWSNGATTKDVSNLPAGTYSVTGTDNNGCKVIMQAQVIGRTKPTVSLGADISITIGKTATLDATTPNASKYLWSNGATTAKIVVSQAGTYAVTVTNSDGCTATDEIKVTTTTSSLDVIDGSNLVDLYPNPVEQILYIQTSQLVEKTFVYGITGQLLYANDTPFEHKTNINIGHLAKGEYLLHLQTKDGIIVKRFTKL